MLRCFKDILDLAVVTTEATTEATSDATTEAASDAATEAASDAALGDVKHLDFDRQSGVTRCLGVGAGAWLFSRKVAEQRLTVSLRWEPVRKSPIEGDKPVMRHMLVDGQRRAIPTGKGRFRASMGIVVHRHCGRAGYRPGSAQSA